MLNDVLPKKYCYDDVLLVPQFSKVKSRTDERLDLSSTVGNVKLSIPIISANMDTVTELDTAKAMRSNGGIGIFHRFYKDQELFKSHIETYKRQVDEVPFLSIGLKTEHKDIDFLEHLLNTEELNLCLDIANADNFHVHEYVVDLLKQFPKTNLIVGNICTGEAAKRLVDIGVKNLKLGIGPGCFTPDMLVNTTNGLVPISKIKVGDLVYTHTGSSKPVIALICYNSKEEIVVINNDIKCTKNHEIYVIHKKDQDSVNESNIHMYAKWIKAEELTTDYLLVELEN